MPAFVNEWEVALARLLVPELLLGPLYRDPNSGLAWPGLADWLDVSAQWLGWFSGPKAREAAILAEGRSACWVKGWAALFFTALQTHEPRGVLCSGPQF